MPSKMRLLFLTNFYPPASRGGYEEWCREVADGLRTRGHDVQVLTSRYRREEVDGAEENYVYRMLHLEMELDSLRNSFSFFTNRASRERANLACLQRHINGFSPNCVLVWGMWNLPRSLAALAETLMPGRIAYYMGDYWPTLPSQHRVYWQVPPRNTLTALPKFLFKPIALRILDRETPHQLKFERVIFPTVFMRDEFKRKGVTVQHAKVIYGAIDTASYTKAVIEKGSYRNGQNQSLQLLYVGRLTSEKGVHTAIEALGSLVHQYGVTDLHLSIVGSGDRNYITHLYHLIEQKKLEPWVTFTGAQPKESLPGLYRRADVFLFTSIWEEPFGRVIVEAMASSLVVIGSLTGGAKEMLIEGETALTFEPGDSEALASQIMRLIESPTLRERLTKTGCKMAVERFDTVKMTTEIEAYLETLGTE